MPTTKKHIFWDFYPLFGILIVYFHGKLLFWDTLTGKFCYQLGYTSYFYNKAICTKALNNLQSILCYVVDIVLGFVMQTLYQIRKDPQIYNFIISGNNSKYFKLVRINSNGITHILNQVCFCK